MVSIGSTIQLIFATLVGVSWFYWLCALMAVRAFFKEEEETPSQEYPPVSILKPLKGLDYQAYENFVSFCRQDYPEYEILFGVLEPTDPVVPVIASLKREFPHRSIQLVVGTPIGHNPKVSNLYHLEKRARYETLVITDSDLRVRAEFLREIVSPLARPRVRLVTALCRGIEARTLWARLEALYLGASLTPSVILGRRLEGMRFALGPIMALRRRDLHKLVGGFEAVRDFLAEDYHLGERMAKKGHLVHLAPCRIDYVIGAPRLPEQWHREVRWMRCIRILRPWGYLGLLITFSTPLALLNAIVCGISAPSGLVLAFTLIVRWLIAWAILERTGDAIALRSLPWLPLRDMLTLCVWIRGLWGRKIRWRGDIYTLMGDGRIHSPGTRLHGERPGSAEPG